jgi:hypothetical protein
VCGYTAAVGGEAGAVALTALLRAQWPAAFPYHSLLIVLVMVAVALQWGLGPCLLASVTAALLANVYLVPPYGD